jgi:hypothetical protein
LLGQTVQILQVKAVAKFARQELIDDASLRDAIDRAECGSIDADLGGGLIKQRVARRGQGRSGGFRLIVAYRHGDRAVFLFGFAKNDRDNISADRLSQLRDLGAVWLTANASEIAQAVDAGILREVRI